jgi:hypothetical protein
MPIYSVRGPDGYIYDIKGPEGASEQQIIAALQQHLLANAPKRGLGAAIGRGAESLASSIRTGAGVYTGSPEEAVRAGMARGEEIGRKYADQYGLDLLKKAYEEKGITGAGKELVRQVPLAIAEQIPTIATSVGGARLGAMAGAPLGPLGAIGGGLTGAAAPLFLEQAGSQAERRAQEQIKRGEPISIDRAELAKFAAPGAAAELAGTFIPIGGRLVSKMTGIPLGAFAGRSAAQAEKLASERLLATLAKGTAKGAAVEIPTEITQQMLERAYAGLPLTGSEAFAEYGELAYRVGLLGPIGAVGRLSEKGAAQQDIADRKAAEAAKARGAAAPEAAPEPEAAPVAPEAPPATPTPAAPETPIAEPQVRTTTPVSTQLAPTEEPVTQQAPNVIKMMDDYEVANAQLEPLETALQNAAKAGDTDAINTLLPQYKELRAQLDTMKSSIEELGGTTKSAETFEQDAAASLAELDKKIANAQKKLDNAADLGDFDVMPKLGENLKTLKAEREAQAAQFDKEREILRVKGTPKGETIDMFGGAAPKAEEVIEEKPVDEKTAKAIETTQKVLDKAVAERDALAAQNTEAAFQAKGLEYAGTPVEKAARREALYKAQQQVDELEQRLARLKAPEAAPDISGFVPGKKEGEKPVKAFQLDLLGDFNLLNTAINNRDERTIEAMRRARENADKKAAGEKYQLTPREQVVDALDQQVGGIVRRERNYDVRVITKGPNEGKEVYIYDSVMAELERLTELVTKPVGNAKRSRLQILHDKWDKLETREAKLAEAKKAKAPKAQITTLENQVATAKRDYQKTLNQVLPIRNQYETVWKSLFTQTGEFAPAPGETATPTILTPRQKREQLLREGKSKRELSKEAKVAKRATEGKVKVSEAKVAQELGETMDEYQAFAAPYQKRLATKAEQHNKFIANANERLAKLKEKYGDTSEKYKTAEANMIKVAKERLAELNQLKADLTAAVGAKAVELGRQHPEFKAKLAEATKEYKEALQDSVQEVKSLRTKQATRKLPRMKTTRTASEESRAETASRQAEFESGLSAEKGEAYDYQQRQEARERTLRARQAKEAKGTAMQVAMTKAAQEKVMSEVSAKEKERYALGSETESKDLTKDQVKLLEENKLQDAYKSISEDDTNQPLNRAVALALEVYADKTDVVIHDTLYSPDGKEALGLATSRKIDLSRDGGLSQEVLLHEGTHSAVERTIQMAQDDITLLSKEQQAAYRELEALYNSVKKDPAITSANAKSNISEFAAEVMSNENLQKQLKQKKWRVSNAFRGFVSIILRMIGVQNVDNMLDASVAAVEALMVQTSIGQKATEQAKAKPKEDIGVFEKAKGAFGFRSETQPTQFASSFVAQEKGAVDNFRANALGLAGRVQFVDQYAALTEALRKGVDSEVVKDLEAEQAEYFLRFGQQRSQFATQFLTNGAVKLVSQDTKRGKEFTYESKPGANMIQVAEALEKSGMGNGTQLEAMFTAYMAGKRAKQVGWDKLNISNPTLAENEYNEVIAALNADPKAKAAFEEAAKIYKQYNAGLLDFLVQTGYMSKAKADELKGIDYVPYYRVKGGELQLLVDKETPVRIANIKDQPELHSLVGDNAQIMPIFTSAVQNTFILTNMGLRNQSIKDTSFLLKRMGIASQLGKGVGPSGPDTVRFKVKGDEYFAVIDSDAYGIPAELIVKGMEGIKTTIPAAVRLMGIPADWLRTFVTRNPAYAIRQAVRDPLTAYMTTGVDGVPVLNSFKELSKMIAGRSEEERKLMASGAISTNVLTGDEKDMEKALRDISAGKSGYTKLLAKADALAMQGDAATRAVIYKDSIAKGMSDMQAYLRTLESMNFSRRGLSPSMQMLSTLIPFFNAQIQGLDVAYRAFTGKYGGMPYQKQLEIKKKLLMRGTLMAMATMAYVMTMEDDEAYKRAKPEERLGNWFVYTPFSDEPLKIPIPFEFGYLFKALPEAVYNMAANDERNKDITKGMGKLIGMSNPFALPAAIKPATEVILGRSFFGGDIESMREQQTMLPTERYRANTTELSKLIGSITGDAGITPIKLDYFLRGHFGGFGMALISLANPILNTEVGADVAEPTLKASKTPFIGGLFQPVEGRGTLDAAYERMLEVQQASGTFKRLLESGKRAEAMEFLEEYRNKVAAISVSGAVQQRLGELSKYRRMIIETPKLTTEQKDVLLDRIDAQQYEIARGFVSLTERTKPQ